MSGGHIPLKLAIKSEMGKVKVSKARSYDKGYKYCSKCTAYYLTDSNRCPYCGNLLRRLPRRRKHMRFKRVNPPPEVLLEANEVKVKLIRRDRMKGVALPQKRVAGGGE